MANHSNRGRLAVDLKGNWRLYSNVLPGHAIALGTVNRDGETGALIHFAQTGVFAQLNAQAVKALDRRKVLAAIAASNAGEKQLNDNA